MTKYDETSDPLSDLPQHPRGIIGAMMANRLLDAGWHEFLMRGYPEKVWVPPDKTIHDGYFLENAFRIAFGDAKVAP